MTGKGETDKLVCSKTSLDEVILDLGAGPVEGVPPQTPITISHTPKTPKAPKTTETPDDVTLENSVDQSEVDEECHDIPSTLLRRKSNHRGASINYADRNFRIFDPLTLL